MVKRSRSRRMAEGAWGMVLLARVVGVVLVAVLLVVAGVWDSWRTAQYVMLSKGRERGTMTLAGCVGSTCTGPFAPSGTATARAKVRISLPIRHDTGAKVPVAVKPGTDTVVRTGWGGILFAWLPLGGALLLAALVLAAGMRAYRTAWAAAACGAALVAGAFLTL